MSGTWGVPMMTYVDISDPLWLGSLALIRRYLDWELPRAWIMKCCIEDPILNVVNGSLSFVGSQSVG